VALTEVDVQCDYQARRLAEEHRRWLIMWSVWHRTFTAFGCFREAPVVLDAPSAEALRQQLQAVELRYLGPAALAVLPIKAGPPTGRQG
jgi:hypothetical protein